MLEVICVVGAAAVDFDDARLEGGVPYFEAEFDGEVGEEVEMARRWW